MLEGMRESTDETCVVLRLRGAIGFVLLAGKERRLGRSCSALPLHPTPAAIRRNQRARIKAHQTFPQRGVGHFQRDAANVFIAEEILTDELEVVKGAGVEEKWIAAPAREEAIVACRRHLCLRAHRDGRSLD